MDNGDKKSFRPPLEFIEAKGSPVTGRHKDKKERIYEALCDLQLAIDGCRTQLQHSEHQEHIGQLQQTAATFARACSIFLRKMLLGDRNKPKSRLLDDEVSRSLGLEFNRLRKISPNIRPLDITSLNVTSGTVQLTKLDEETSSPQSVYNLPISPMQFKIKIEWPLPGTANWLKTPTQEEPWQVSSKELFDIYSNDSLDCNEWLGQQLVIFDNKGITLKNVIRTVVTYEGAHSINVSRLIQIEGKKDYTPAKNPELHILNNIKIFGIKYSHIIVIESAIYLYEKLFNNKEIRKLLGDGYLPIFCFCPNSSEDIFSYHPEWLTFDGGVILSFGNKEQLISHSIRAVR